MCQLSLPLQHACFSNLGKLSTEQVTLEYMYTAMYCATLSKYSLNHTAFSHIVLEWHRVTSERNGQSAVRSVSHDYSEGCRFAVLFLQHP